MTMSTPGLILNKLVIGYSHPLLEPLSIDIHAGKTLAVLGPSGCGKSTLLATIVGMTPALSGSIILNGRDISNVPIHQRGIGLVFQEPLLFSHLSLVDNIAYGLRAAHVDKEIARAKADELLDWVGLSSIKHQKTWEISGGQAGRVALARALAPNPEALLFDEPYSALDNETRLRLSQEVRDLLRQRNIPAIHVTHDRIEAESVADQLLVLP
jgi:thiamine transport system ATP-binding protein